jgi:hypothetical protein
MVALTSSRGGLWLFLVMPALLHNNTTPVLTAIALSDSCSLYWLPYILILCARVSIPWRQVLLIICPTVLFLLAFLYLRKFILHTIVGLPSIIALFVVGFRSPII